ncbi:unnamed protein product, partial [Discosporangium mesarthrocarpum]
DGGLDSESGSFRGSNSGVFPKVSHRSPAFPRQQQRHHDTKAPSSTQATRTTRTAAATPSSATHLPGLSSPPPLRGGIITPLMPPPPGPDSLATNYADLVPLDSAVPLGRLGHGAESRAEVRLVATRTGLVRLGSLCLWDKLSGAVYVPSRPYEVFVDTGVGGGLPPEGGGGTT